VVQLTGTADRRAAGDTATVGGVADVLARAAMDEAILAEGAVMQSVGDAVMAVSGAPCPVAGHARAAVRAAVGMHERPRALDARWASEGLGPAERTVEVRS
jgi:hypothetical protein